jgi:hypothetical protein
LNEVLAFAAFLLLPIVGLGSWRLEAVRRMDLGGRIAVAGAFGAATVAAVLAMLSIASISWSRTVVLSIVAVITAFSVYLALSKK